jgi:cytidine deaminase
MKESVVRCVYREYAGPEELPAADRELVEAARRSAAGAYAPYSRFRVGAAIRLASGNVVTGSNQENASYPEGLCAERVALFAAGATFPGDPIEALAVSAQSEEYRIDRPVTPCGACRQAMAEYEHRYGQPFRILMTGESGPVLVAGDTAQLLPVQFDASLLKKPS